MKILTSNQLRATDQYTIEQQPISSFDLMERAARMCFEWLVKKYSKPQHFSMVCGNGNNGGDGLAIGRMLIQDGYDVDIFVLPFATQATSDFTENLARLNDQGISTISQAEDLEFNQNTIIIDALLGTGVTRPTSGLLKHVIQIMNQSRKEIVAIDMPSGLFAEQNSANEMEGVIQASHTLTFNSPKLSFLFSDNYPFVGSFHILDIGLDQAFIESLDSPYTCIDESLVNGLIKTRKKFDHKGTFGHALIIAGSRGMMGAAILSAKAALKSGAGKVTLHIPKCGYEIIQTAVPEAMVSISDGENWVSDIPNLDGFTAVAIGPGIGTHNDTRDALKQLLDHCDLPLVVDADALNILSSNKDWISSFKRETILTPHPGEFMRLAKLKAGNFDALQVQRELAQSWNASLILKGAHTSMAMPNGHVYFNSSGNAELATAGSGDVLTGIITGLLAQGYSAKDASIIGVYQHGLAADHWLAKNKNPMQHMIASDIIEKFNGKL